MIIKIKVNEGLLGTLDDVTIIGSTGNSFAEKYWPKKEGEVICIDTNQKFEILSKPHWKGIFDHTLVPTESEFIVLPRTSLNLLASTFLGYMQEKFIGSFKNNNGQVGMLISEKEIVTLNGHDPILPGVQRQDKHVRIKMICGEKVFETDPDKLEEDDKRIITVDPEGSEEYFLTILELESKSLKPEFREARKAIQEKIEGIKKCFEKAKNSCEDGESNQIDCSKINP